MTHSSPRKKDFCVFQIQALHFNMCLNRGRCANMEQRHRFQVLREIKMSFN